MRRTAGDDIPFARRAAGLRAVMAAPRRPEDCLLLYSARSSIAPRTVDAVTVGLTDSLDWEYVIRTAVRHQVLPLLHRALVGVGEGATVPPSARASLERELDARVARNRRLAAELVRLLRLAARANVAMLPFKGPVLAAAVYGDLAMRQFADLDLLIDAGHAAGAEEFLRSLGYRCREDFGWAAHFVHDDMGFCVDLHRGSLTPEGFPVSLDFSRLWSRREAVSLEGETVETLSTDDLVLLLCIQAARDAWQGKSKLGKICDIGHVLAARDRSRWPRVTAEARALRVARVLEFGIHLAARVLQLPIAAALVPSPHRGIAELVRQEDEALFDDPAAPRESRARGHLSHFHLRERWKDKLHPYRTDVLRLMVPTRRDRDWLMLPPGVSWLYYVLRPIRLLRQYGRYLAGGRLE